MFTQSEPKIQMIKYTTAHHVSFERKKKITDSILILKAVPSVFFFTLHLLMHLFGFQYLHLSKTLITDYINNFGLSLKHFAFQPSERVWRDSRHLAAKSWSEKTHSADNQHGNWALHVNILHLHMSIKASVLTEQHSWTHFKSSRDPEARWRDF